MTGLEKQKALLERLAKSPPQTLLLEGGSENTRLDLALHWAKTVNCPSALAESGDTAVPCLNCAVCRQIQANEYLDLLIYDGRISNRADEETPGPVRALRMENMRDLKSVTGTAPHGNGKRVAIFQGMSQTREEALNSLLKTLEEPSAHTLFVLLTPQRQQLLPTLVSRSFCVILPWNSSLAERDNLPGWEESMADFLKGGTGFLDKISGKGAVDSTLAGNLLLAIQAGLVRVLSGNSRSRLDAALLPIGRDGKKAALASNWLGQAQDMLACTVTPARVLEAFFSRLFTLLRD